MKREFAADLQDAAVTEMHEDVLQQTILALETVAVRAMDAIHIGTAIESFCDLFLSADPRQCKAARKMGLKAEEAN